MTVELMDIVDAPFPEAHLDAEMMARLGGDLARGAGHGHHHARVALAARV